MPGGETSGTGIRKTPPARERVPETSSAPPVAQEKILGSLEGGKRADLVVLDGDDLLAAEVKNIRPTLTMVGGGWSGRRSRATDDARHNAPRMSADRRQTSQVNFRYPKGLKSSGSGKVLGAGPANP